MWALTDRLRRLLGRPPAGVCGKCWHDEQAHGMRDSRLVCARCKSGAGCNVASL